jgi:hypothetical protein
MVMAALKKILVYASAFTLMGTTVYTCTQKASAVKTNITNTLSRFLKSKENDLVKHAVSTSLAAKHPLDGINLTQDFRQEMIFDEVISSANYGTLNVTGRIKNKSGISAFSGTMEIESVASAPYQSNDHYFDDVKIVSMYDVVAKIKGKIFSSNNTIEGPINMSLLKDDKGQFEQVNSIVFLGKERNNTGELISVFKQSRNLEEIDINIYDQSSIYERSVPLKEEYVRKGWSRKWEMDGDQWYALK